MPKPHVAIVVCLVDLFAVDQDQPRHAKKGKLLYDVGTQTTDAYNGNGGGSQSILPSLTKEASITIVPLAIREKG